MTDKKISYDNLPQAVQELHQKLDRLLSIRLKQPEESNKLLTVEELQNHLPEHPAKQTIYGWVNGRVIPYEKYGKRLYFRQSDIDKWTANGRQK